jgi:radical SAM superfamily enzyme YgiQ (UPF0313 family)
MKILLVYPQYPDTFWSFKHALKFISKKAVNPPLGLITVSSMLPEEWEKKLVDLNIESLNQKDVQWADYIFFSAMNVQAESAIELIELCKSQNKQIVCGGPLFTEEPENFQLVDHLILNEAELTLPGFLQDLKNGNPKHIYQSDGFANLENTPLPDYSLVKTSKYNTMNLQLTRGCPFNCEFCDITALFGHKVRIKTTEQIINELEAIYNTGWRKNVFFVDDNFIGNKKILKTDLLPSIIQWMKNRNYPFTFSTEASINLSDDDLLMELMSKAGFSTVFIGIETTEQASLEECGKVQNTNRDLIQSVHQIQEYGLEVNGGFILGFDNDSPAVFQKQIDFIRDSGIISAMVGLLNAPKKTRLYKRLKQEGRITSETTGNNTDFSLNFIPKMDKEVLIDGYKKVINEIYGGNEYYNRVLDFIQRFTPNRNNKLKLNTNHLIAFSRSFFRLGIVDTYRKHYWNLFFWTLFNRPKLVPLAITYSVYGFHFRKIFKDVL